ELRALVEERRVVLVGLDDEHRTVAIVTGRYFETRCDAPDQEVGRPPRLAQYPCQHGAGAGLAVRAGYSHDMLPAQDRFTEPLRPRRVGQALVENGFHQWIAAADHVADDVQVGLQRDLV